MIRIQRTLVYTYDDAEAMLRDMAHWGVGANAHLHPASDVTIRSATLPPETIPDVDELARAAQDLIAAARPFADIPEPQVIEHMTTAVHRDDIQKLNQALALVQQLVDRR